MTGEDKNGFPESFCYQRPSGSKIWSLLGFLSPSQHPPCRITKLKASSLFPDMFSTPLQGTASETALHVAEQFLL